MSVAGAIQSGAAFVKFFGDANDLFKTTKDIGKELSTWSKNVAGNVSSTVAGGFQSASAAATNFGAKSAAAMTTAATSTQAVAASAFRIPSAFGAASGVLRFVAGNLGNISRGAGLASWSLWGVSKVLRNLGYDTAKLDMVKNALSRIGWAARAGAIGLGGMRMAAQAMLFPLRAASMAGAGLSRLGRFGSIASIGSMAAMSAAPSESISDQVGEGAQKKEKTGGGFTKYLMPVLTGLAIAGPIGAAAVGLGVFIAGAFQQSAKSGTGFFATLMERASAWGAWMSGLWGQVTAKVQAVFGQMSSTAEPFITRLEKAFIPLTYAIENVWLPAFLGAIEYAGSFFKSNTDSMGGSWTSWILDSVSALAEFVGNFDLYFQIAQQTIVMWASNSILRVGDFFTNIGEWLGWFGDNWKSVLLDVGNVQITFLTNMFANFKNAFTSVINFAKGKGFKFDMVSPLEGFESSIKELPKLTKTALETMTPELQALYEQLGKRQAAAAAHGQMIEGVQQAGAAGKAGKETAIDSRYGASTLQSQEAYSALSRLQNANMTASNPQVAEQKKTNIELAKQTRQLEKIAANANPKFEAVMIP